MEANLLSYGLGKKMKTHWLDLLMDIDLTPALARCDSRQNRALKRAHHKYVRDRVGDCLSAKDLDDRIHEMILETLNPFCDGWSNPLDTTTLQTLLSIYGSLGAGAYYNGQMARLDYDCLISQISNPKIYTKLLSA